MNNYYNSFTKELDRYNLIYEEFKNKDYAECWRTYLWEHGAKNAGQVKEIVIAFRVPGATRGHIRVDKDFVIKKIEFYESTCFSKGLACYKETVREVIPKFLGTKLEV